MDLTKFVFDRELNRNSEGIVVLGRMPNDTGGSDQAVLKITRPQINPSQLRDVAAFRTRCHTQNGIFTTFAATRVRIPELPLDLTNCDLVICVIFPATAHIIGKYTSQPLLLVQETPEQYATVIKPFLHELVARTHCDNWVYDILDGRQEQGLIVHKDELVVICQDESSPFDCANPVAMHLLVLPRNAPRTGQTMRDLTAADLPWLQHTLNTVPLIVQSAMQRQAQHIQTTQPLQHSIPHSSASNSNHVIALDEIITFFHYPPTFMYLHIHVQHTRFEPTFGSRVGQSHLLSDVVDCLKMCDGYFNKRTLAYCATESDWTGKARATAIAATASSSR
jgi:m7GpppX diphosphatase